MITACVASAPQMANDMILKIVIFYRQSIHWFIVFIYLIEIIIAMRGELLFILLIHIAETDVGMVFHLTY